MNWDSIHLLKKDEGIMPVFTGVMGYSGGGVHYQASVSIFADKVI